MEPEGSQDSVSLLVLADSLLQDEAALVLMFQVAHSLDVEIGSDRGSDQEPAESLQWRPGDDAHVKEMGRLGSAHGEEGEKTPYCDVFELVETIHVGCEINLVLSLGVFIQLNGGLIIGNEWHTLWGPRMFS